MMIFFFFCFFFFCEETQAVVPASIPHLYNAAGREDGSRHQAPSGPLGQVPVAVAPFQCGHRRSAKVHSAADLQHGHRSQV